MARVLLLHVISFICFWTVKDIFAAEENLTTCRQFLTYVRLTNTLTIRQHQETPCPCFEQKVALDYSFHKDGNCFKQWFSEGKMKQKCCYDSNGKILFGPKNGGYAIPDSLESNIEDIHDTCCTDNVMCKRFYELFPSDKCSTNTRHIEGEGKMTCQEFTADISLRNLIDIGQTKAQPCPCIEQIIAIDYTFEKKKNCYRQWLFTDDVKQMCCYSDNGQLILDGPGAGYLLLKSKEDYIDHTHDTCCRDGSITYDKTCRSFYQINPPDNCSSYVPPRVSLSSGDPMIQTIDGEKYSFNGHGEYVFLTDNKTFEIQARTEYVVKGNHDSTYFSAFALKDINSKEEIELHYNKDSKVIQLYRNGKCISNCTSNVDPKPCVMGRNKCSAIAGNKRILLVGCRFPNYITNMEFSTDNFMTVTIKRQHGPNTAKNLMGLAGDTENGSYIMRNSSTVSVNGSELQLFEFAETWSLQNENESIFRYNETGGNYTLYNHHHTRPEFLEDKLGNLTELFEGYSEDNITKFNQTCRNYWNNEHNNQCLLTIARTNNYTLGLAVMREANAIRHDHEILHNKPPKFTNDTPHFLNVSYGITEVFNLTEYARDDFDGTDKIQYRVITNLTEYNIVNGVFNWTVGKELRYDDVSFTFILNDTSGFTAQHDMTIYYCGCEQNSQCDYSSYNKNSSNTIKKALCNCPEYTSGLYCEIEEDPCKDNHCNTTCNRTLSRTLPSWPCEECPEGRRNNIVNKHQTCENIDECTFNETNPCDHICNDTDGSYNCSCTDGYKLNVDNHTCDDNDECIQDKNLCTKDNEVCYNTPGNYSCICRPDYVRNDDKNCVKSNGPHFVGNIVFTITKMDIKDVKKANKAINQHDNENVTGELNKLFQNVSNVYDVEVVNMFYVKRGTDAYELHIEFVVNCKNATNYEELGKQIPAFDPLNCKIKIGDMEIKTNPSVFKINSSKDGGICKFHTKTNCPGESTDCIDTDNGTYSCQCKSGFEPDVLSEGYCKDIDECKLFKDNATVADRCVHGICTNGVGLWNCTCPPDQLWQNVGNTTYPVYRCQGNFSHIGNITILDYKGAKEETVKMFFHNQFRKFFTNPKNENKTYPTPMKELYVSATILNLTETLREANFHKYNVMYRLRFGEAIERERVSNVLKTVLGERGNNSLEISFANNSFYMFKDSDNILCDLTSNGFCDLASTNCRQRNGSTFCDCKHGYEKLRQSERFCTDVDECSDGPNRCNNEQCLNSPSGSWSCECRGKDEYSVTVNDDRDNFKCRNLTICEREQKNFDCINGNRTCVGNEWVCKCDTGLSPVLKDNGQIMCEGDYKYIMSTGIDVPSNVDLTAETIEKFEKYMKEQITSAYSYKFPGQHVIVEILSLDEVNVKKQKRSASKTLKVDFILHFDKSIDHKNISNTWTEYVKQNCSGGCKTSKEFKDLPQIILDEDIEIEEDQTSVLCSRYNHCNKVSSTCQLEDGKVTCACKKGYTKQNSTCEVSRNVCKEENPCESGGTCNIVKSKSDKPYNLTCLCTEGRKGAYCEEVDDEFKVQKEGQTIDTTVVAISSSLGGFILVLVAGFLVMYRRRGRNPQEAEKISMKPMDSNGSNNFNGSFLTNQYLPDLPDRDDDAGSFYSRRLSHSSLPFGHQNGVTGGGGYLGNPNLRGLYSMPKKLPRPNFHGSMPNLADGGINLNQYDNKRYSGEGPRHMHSYDQGLNQNLNFDRRAPRNNWNGRRSPSPDYERPKSPKPDYHQARNHYRSRDSGVGNGNSSGSNEYKQPERRRDYFYGQRQTTNF